MQIQFYVTCETRDEASRILDWLYQQPAQAAVAIPEVPPKQTTEPAEAKPEVTEKDCRKRLTDIVDAQGAAAAKAKLTAFGVEKVSDLKPEQYADFLASLG